MEINDETKEVSLQHIFWVIYFELRLNTQHSEKQHDITRQCYLQLNTTDNDKTTRILTKITT